jgi:hypothetical protein
VRFEFKVKMMAKIDERFDDTLYLIPTCEISITAERYKR